MKTFSIPAYLAAGLSHRLEKLDAQLVADTVGGDPEQAIRSNLRVVKNIEEANKEFMDATRDTMMKKTKIFEELQKHYEEVKEGLSEEERTKKSTQLTEEFTKKAAEVQKESRSLPYEVVKPILSNEDYKTVLLPLFKKTAGTWDGQNDGSGQKTFIEVADAINAVSDVS